MLTELRTKIRALIEDFSKSDFQIFQYTNSNIFTLAEPNIVNITKVLINGNELQSGESFSFDSSTNKITISGVSFNLGDAVEVDFTFNKYNDSELNEYIRASLVWLGTYDYNESDFELEENGIYPTPNNKEEDMISIISSILIKPDYTSYKLPNVSVVYPEHITKEERIRDLIAYFKHGIGAVGYISWHESSAETQVTDFEVISVIKTKIKQLNLKIYRKTKTTYTLEILGKNGSLVDLTGGMIYLTVKNNMEDDDIDAVISKDITPSNPIIGRENIIFTEIDTDRNGNFYYDVKYVDSDSNSYILLQGKIKFIESVTKRS